MAKFVEISCVLLILSEKNLPGDLSVERARLCPVKNKIQCAGNAPTLLRARGPDRYSLHNYNFMADFSGNIMIVTFNKMIYLTLNFKYLTQEESQNKILK